MLSFTQGISDRQLIDQTTSHLGSNVDSSTLALHVDERSSSISDDLLFYLRVTLPPFSPLRSDCVSAGLVDGIYPVDNRTVSAVQS